MNGRVVLEVPAKPEYLLLARLAVTSVGRSAGASEETIARTCQTMTRAKATRPSANLIKVLMSSGPFNGAR